MPMPRILSETHGLHKVEPDVYKSPFQLRLIFGCLLSHDLLLTLVGNRRRWLMESMLTLEEREHDLQRRRYGATPEKTLVFPWLIVQLKLATFRAEIEWADRTVEQLKQWDVAGGCREGVMRVMVPM